MIRGVGTDVIGLARIQKALESPRFFERDRAGDAGLPHRRAV